MILNKVHATIRRHAMLAPHDRVVVAVSGGADSVALLHVLLEMRDAMDLVLTVAHLDHALRGADSEADRAYVEELATRWGLPCVARREEVAALARRERRSLEDAGRVARRRFLREVAESTSSRRVAMGHHREDQAESVLLRLIAGSGLGGLSGVRPVADGLFVRPLLDCSRAEIHAYLDTRAIASREDATNADLRFPRNRVRHTLLPLLKEGFNPRVTEAIARTADILREEDAYLDRRARRLLQRLLIEAPYAVVSAPAPAQAPGASVAGAAHPAGPAPAGDAASRDVSPAPLVLDAVRLRRLPAPIARRVVRLALRRAGLRGRDFARARIDDVLALASRGEPRALSLGEAFTARWEYGRLRLERTGREPLRRAVRARLTVPGEIPVVPAGVSVRARLAPRGLVEGEYRAAPADRIYVDAAALRSPLTVRGPRTGDRFQPLGAPGTRKLSDIWTDLKVGREARRRSLIVESDGRIVWAVGLRMANPFRITEATTHVAILDVVDLPTPAVSAAVSSVSPDPQAGPAAPNRGTVSSLRNVLYSEDQIRAAVDRLASEVAAWAAGGEILVLGVLQGSFIFLADLVRRLPGPLKVGFLDREGSPIPPFPALEGARVLLVEDILDTGESLLGILEKLRGASPAQVRTCVLFDKPSGRRAAIEADWAGLPVPDRWVVGYGLDAGGHDRNLPYLSWV